MAECDDLTEKYEIIIEMGREVSVLDEKYKTDENLVRGCQSLLHVFTRLEEDKVFFYRAGRMR